MYGRNTGEIIGYRTLLAVLAIVIIAVPAAVHAGAPDTGGSRIQSLQPMLSVYSSPSGATLFIDGISVGTTPYTTSTLPAGTHAITLKLSGYADYTDSLVTVASNPVTKQYTLVPVTTPVPVSFIPIRPGTVTPTATATAVPELRLTVVPRVSFTALPRVSPVTTPVASAMVPAEPGARVSNATLPNLQNIRPFYGVQKQTVGQYSRNVYYTSIRPASSLTLDNPSQTILLISKSSSDKLTCKPEKNIAGGGQAEKNDYASDENDCQIVTTYGWGESMTQFNVSPDLKNYPFLWATHAENVSRGEWQVSNFPFPDREKSWSNPPDLVAYGTVQGRPAPSTIFTIPFDSFTDLAYGAAPVNADLMNQRPTYMLAQPGRFSGISTYQIEAGKWISGVSVGNSGVGIVSTRFNIGSVSFAVPTGIAMMPSPDTIPYASGTVYGDTITRMKFVPGALSTRMASRDRVYYIRMVALDANGNAVDKPSPDVELDIRAAPLYLFPGDEKTSAWVSPNDDGCRHGEFDTPCDASDIASLNNGASERTTLSQSWTTEVSMSVNDLNQLLFKWTSGEQNVHAGEWQLLNTKYPLDETDWEHPHGFVAEGQISTGKYFPIDLQKYNLASGNYYLRVLPLDAGNNALGPPSGLLKITVTDAPVTTVVNCDAQNVIKDRRPPSISLISYTPIQSGKPDAELHFIWANDCSSGCLPFGPHHKGDKISFQPHENSWWDDFVDAIGDVISFVGDLVNWVSDAWNSIKNEAVSLVASAIPGCSGSDACTGALSGALDYGLTAMGVPPTLPTFSDLENMGTNYMVELGTSEIGADGIVSPDQVRSVAGSLVADHESLVGSGDQTGPWPGLVPDPDYQHQPAYIIVEASNPNSMPTDISTLTYSDHLIQNLYCDNTATGGTCPTTLDQDKIWAAQGKIPQSPEDHLFVSREMPIPSLQPGQSIRIPIILTEDYGYWANDTGYGSMGAMFPDQAFEENYRSSSFTISVTTPDMRDPDPLSEIIYFGSTPPANACPAQKVHAPVDGWIQATIPAFTVNPPSLCYSGSVACSQPYQVWGAGGL